MGVCDWSCSFNVLSLSFLICKMGLIIMSILEGCCEVLANLLALFKTSVFDFKLQKKKKKNKQKKLGVMQLCDASLTSHQHECTCELSATRSPSSGPGGHVNQGSAPTPTPCPQDPQVSPGTLSLWGSGVNSGACLLVSSSP